MTRHPDPFNAATAPVDQRLLAPGLAVTIADVVAVFTDHRPGDMPTCAACRHRYTTAAPQCPSRTLAAQLLRRRRHEDPRAVADVAAELGYVAFTALVAIESLGHDPAAILRASAAKVAARMTPAAVTP